LQASIGMGRIGFIQNQLDQRKNNARYVVDGIVNKNVKEFDVVKGGIPNYYALLLRLSFSDNSHFINFLSQKGIPSDILRYNYKVLYKYPILEALAGDCENAELLSKSITTIPVHPGLNIEDLDYIISQINAF
jgi:perosamine synthetase